MKTKFDAEIKGELKKLLIKINNTYDFHKLINYIDILKKQIDNNCYLSNICNVKIDNFIGFTKRNGYIFLKEQLENNYEKLFEVFNNVYQNNMTNFLFANDNSDTMFYPSIMTIFEDVEYFNQNDFIKNLEGISGLHSMYFRLICGYQSIDKFIPLEAEEIDDKFEIIKTLLQKNSSFSGFELYLLNKNFLEEIYSKIGFLDIGFVSLYLKSLLIGALSSLIYGEVKYGLTDEEVKLINLIKKNPKIKRIEFVDYGFCDKSVYNYCVKICKKIGIIDSKNKGTGLKMLKNIIKDGIFDYLADKK